MSRKTKVTIRLTDILVTIDCPHEAVDTETLHDVAMRAIGDGVSSQVIPRYEDVDVDDSPVFKTFVESIDEPEIENDDRTEKPDEFHGGLRWWQDLQPANPNESLQGP